MTGTVEDSRSLVETNIVVYAHDRGDLVKHAIALALLRRLSSRGRLVLSAQVFNEFCSVMMRPKRSPPLSPDQTLVILQDLTTIVEIVPVTVAMSIRAVGAMQQNGLSFWNALIWAAAAENPRDLTILHGPCLIGYLLDRAQIGVPPGDCTAGATPWTTCPASAA